MKATATLVLGLLIAAISAPDAQGDETVAAVARPTPVSAFGGVLAWSGYDAATGRYVLMASADGAAPAPVPVPLRHVPFDVDLGPAPRGGVVAAYSRCRTDPRRARLGNALVQMPGWSTGRGCDLYRFDFATGRETRIAGASTKRASEFLPSIWRGRVAFARVYENRRGAAGRRPYLYRRALGGRTSRRLPAGARSRYRVCVSPPHDCSRTRLIVEPGPTSLDLFGRHLAFGWDSGTYGPTSAVYLISVTAARVRRRLLQRVSSGSLQGLELVSPAFAGGGLLWGSIAFGETQANELRRLDLAGGVTESAPLPPAAAQDAFARPVLATAAYGADVFYLISGAFPAGEPGCRAEWPCSSEPGCSADEQCSLRRSGRLDYRPVNTP